MNKVKIENGWVSLDVYPGGNTYDIELTRIPDERALLTWAYHIAGKKWGTPQLIREFVKAVCDYRAWGEPHPTWCYSYAQQLRLMETRAKMESATNPEQLAGLALKARQLRGDEDLF